MKKFLLMRLSPTTMEAGVRFRLSSYSQVSHVKFMGEGNVEVPVACVVMYLTCWLAYFIESRISGFRVDARILIFIDTLWLGVDAFWHAIVTSLATRSWQNRSSIAPTELAYEACCIDTMS